MHALARFFYSAIMAYRKRRVGGRRKTRAVRRTTGRRRKLGVSTVQYRRRGFNLGPAMAGAAAGAIGRAAKRRFFGPKPNPKRQRAVGDKAGYIQWEKSTGSKKLGRMTQRKFNLANSSITDLVFKRTGRLDLGGQIFAGGWDNIVASPNESTRPIFLFDLTSGRNSSTTANPMHTLVRSHAVTPSYTMLPVLGQGPTSTVAVPVLGGAWQVGTASSGAYLDAISILKWTELRFDFWGAKDHPCEWTVTLCQFDEDVLPPPSTLVISDRQAVDWWDQVSSKLIFSPSERKAQNGIGRNMMKVLDRRSFILNPTSTTESDADPHVRSVRLFYNMNRKVNFVWRNAAPTLGVLNTDPAQNPGWDTSLFSDLYDTAEPKARVYVMVTCANWRAPPTTVGGMTTANTGSFNMSVYSRWIN